MLPQLQINKRKERAYDITQFPTPDKPLNRLPFLNYFQFMQIIKHQIHDHFFKESMERKRIAQFTGIGIKRQQYLKVIIEYLYRVISEKNRATFSKIVERLLAQGDGDMRKFSNIFQELGYVAGESDQRKRDEIKLKHKDKTIRKNEEVIQRKNEALREKNEAVQEKDEAIKKTVRNLLKKDFTAKEISSVTGLSISIIDKIKKRRDG